MYITDSEKSPKVCHQVESHDTKYVSGLSTILVASIQEAKDRISQVEYIFCSQLYPNFQKSSKSLQKLFLEAKSAAENEWQQRLEFQRKQLCVEKEQTLDECNSAFKVEKSRLLRRIAELEDKLSLKAKEVDDGLELHAKLLDLNKENNITLADKKRLLKEREERMKHLVTKSEELEGNMNALSKELQEKIEEVTKEKELTKELRKLTESQELKITKAEQMLANSQQEKKQLSMKLENVEASLDDLRNELRRKIAEADEGKQLQEKLMQQVNLYGAELTKKNQQLSAHEREKQMLLSKINLLQNKEEELRESLKNGNAGVTNMREPRNDLAKQIEQLNSELAAEKVRRRDSITAFKKLKSQQCYLLKKFGLTDGDLPSQTKAEEDSDPSNKDETNIGLPEIKKKSPVNNVVACALNKAKQEIKNVENSDDEKIVRLNHIASSKSPSVSDSPTMTRWTTSRNLGSVANGKRSRSGWRETRSRQSPGGPDPHDDFLNTPYENIRGNLHKTTKDSVRDVPAEHSKDIDSDDETQDIKAEAEPKRQQLEVPRSAPKSFKYVEPVRKKAERENLNGVECKQCKKFYDAVLSDAVPKNGEVDKQTMRCEHHDGVSRHRYRYVPPMTPEGFWNIGFDSET